jgi:Tfp pilus assembly protein PilF
MGPGTVATLAAALLLGSSSGVSPASARAQLDAGVKALNNFDNAQARRIFTRLLAESPPSSIAAKVHVYLGIIEFDGLDTDRAREEFQRAVEIDPAVELPLTASPKARMAFSEARRKVSAELAQPYAQPPAPGPDASVPAEAVEPFAAQSVSHGHTAAYVLGSVAIVGVALAIIGVVYIENFESLQGKLRTDPTYTEYQADTATAVSEGPTAQIWEGVAIAAGAVALGAGTGAGFAW